VLHHGHSGARQHEHDHARDVEPARVIAPGADDIDRAAGPRLHPRINGATSKRRREPRDFLRRFAPFRQGQEKPTLRLVGFRRFRQRRCRGFDF
jgi:hypothetical protein